MFIYECLYKRSLVESSGWLSGGGWIMKKQQSVCVYVERDKECVCVYTVRDKGIRAQGHRVSSVSLLSSLCAQTQEDQWGRKTNTLTFLLPSSCSCIPRGHRRLRALRVYSESLNASLTTKLKTTKQLRMKPTQKTCDIHTYSMWLHC